MWTQPKPLRESFDGKWIPEPNSGCWLWTAAVTAKGGYGVVWGREKKTYFRAHVASWILNRGEVPDGMQVLHTCDTPSCVNPDHLWLGTNLDNRADMMRKGRYRNGNPNHKEPKVTRKI